MSQRKSVYSGSPYEKSIGFCRAVRVGNHIAVSGTAPIDDDGKSFAPGDPEKQARRCFQIAQKAIEELGGTLKDVIRTRMFLTDAADWEKVGKVHGEFFAEIQPAATMVVVKELVDPAWLVEIEVDAEVG